MIKIKHNMMIFTKMIILIMRLIHNSGISSSNNSNKYNKLKLNKILINISSNNN